MKIKQKTKNSESVKLYHRQAGDVIRFINGDGSMGDSDFYLVLADATPQGYQEHRTHMRVLNLHHHYTIDKSVSSRTVLYKDATLTLGDPS